MKSTTKPDQTVDEYIAGAPEAFRSLLEFLRQVMRAAAPEAEELISYRIPTYRHHGPLVHFAAFKDHCSLIVVRKELIATFEEELKGFKTTGTTIHFTPENPLPRDLIEKIVRLRIQDNTAVNKLKKKS